MEDYLKSIGFYTLEDSRAKNVGINSPLWRCELLITSRCNFKCPYCRGVNKEDEGDLPVEDASRTIALWCNEGLKNIRFSGGEPTLYQQLPTLVYLAKIGGVERIAISTNGSARMSLYKELIELGVNDISISLDSYCSSTGNKMAGGLNVFDKVISNIRELSKLTYVTTGTVITDDNIDEVENIIEFAHNLGVDDIRLITEAQRNGKKLPHIDHYENKYPILFYRLNNLRFNIPIRGVDLNDNHKCPLVLDDMAVLNNKHYPCIIYLREGGSEIGKVGRSMRKQREEWYLNHNCYEDKICRNNCLDVCVDYNNRVKDTNNILNGSPETASDPVPAS